MISLQFSSGPKVGAGVGPSLVTGLLRELKARGGSEQGRGPGGIKEGIPERESPQSLISDLPGNFMIWLIVECFFLNLFF